jgi:hypothetical protein
MNDDGFLWLLPALMAAVVGLQLRYGRILVGWSGGDWRFVEKVEDEGRFWLFIVGEGLVTVFLIGQALSV